MITPASVERTRRNASGQQWRFGRDCRVPRLKHRFAARVVSALTRASMSWATMPACVLGVLRQPEIRKQRVFQFGVRHPRPDLLPATLSITVLVSRFHAQTEQGGFSVEAGGSSLLIYTEASQQTGRGAKRQDKHEPA